MNVTIEDVLGFSTAEKIVWHALSEEGQSISALTVKSKLPRMTVHKAVHRFCNRSLARRLKRNRRFVFVRTSMTELYERLFVNEEHLTGSSMLQMTQEVGITTYRGKDVILEKLLSLALVTHRRWTLVQSNSSTAEILKRIPVDKIKYINELIYKNSQITDLYVEEAYIDSIRKNIDAEKFVPWLQSLNRLSVVYVFPKGFMHAKNDLMIFDDSLFIIDWSVELMFEIQHSETVQYIKNMLTTLAEFGKKTDLRRMIELHMA